MTRESALKLLSLESAACVLTPEIVMTAFHKAVVMAHPDTAAPGEAKGDMTALLKAKKMLLEHLVDADSTCKLCGGLGSVASKMGRRACVACKGTGDKQ